MSQNYVWSRLFNQTVQDSNKSAMISKLQKELHGLPKSHSSKNDSFPHNKKVAVTRQLSIAYTAKNNNRKICT